jgi:putative membrane protein insertion efficiency factor
LVSRVGVAVGVALVRGYQALRVGRASPCRFVPSCSEYAVLALEEHGLLRGCVLAARRLLRCRPGGGFGYDPVPLGRTSEPV